MPTSKTRISTTTATIRRRRYTSGGNSGPSSDIPLRITVFWVSCMQNHIYKLHGIDKNTLPVYCGSIGTRYPISPTLETVIHYNASNYCHVQFKKLTRTTPPHKYLVPAPCPRPALAPRRLHGLGCDGERIHAAADPREPRASRLGRVDAPLAHARIPRSRRQCGGGARLGSSRLPAPRPTTARRGGRYYEAS